MWYSGQLIPTNIITGFLGTGKTTAILELLKQRPAGERWSVFVNEYGMVSIDDVLMEGQSQDVQIQELAGGCFCCTTSAMMDTVLMQFIRRTKPDRLLIEPSGAGHPARVIDALRGERFRQALDLRATICLVDPKDYENPRVTNSEGFHDQIQMSDVVAVNWTDKRERSQIDRCLKWIEQFDPPKLLIAETQHGHLKPEWLDLVGTVVRPPLFPHAHSVERHHTETHASTMVSLEPRATADMVVLKSPIQPGHPMRLENEGGGQRACGWIFAPGECFDREQLFDYLAAINPVQRVKGIFHCEDDWWMINRSGSTITVKESAYRRDSRCEIITNEAIPTWSDVENAILLFRL